MCGFNRHWRFNDEELFHDGVWARLLSPPTNNRGMVPNLYMCRGAAVSAAQLELHSRGVAGWSHHCPRLLHHDMGGIGGQGEDSQRIVQSNEKQHPDRSDF